MQAFWTYFRHKLVSENLRQMHQMQTGWMYPIQSHGSLHTVSLYSTTTQVSEIRHRRRRSCCRRLHKRFGNLMDPSMPVCVKTKTTNWAQPKRVYEMKIPKLAFVHRPYRQPLEYVHR